MLSLEAGGCHNINFVTPTHHADVVAEAIGLARGRGLEVPVVYNCGDTNPRKRCGRLRRAGGHLHAGHQVPRRGGVQAVSDAPDYPERVKEALKIMQSQVGDLDLRRGIAKRGLLVRHLVMPSHGFDALAIMEFLHREVAEHAHVNVMGQYWPTVRVG